MRIMQEVKSSIIKKYQRHESDTASPEVQIALLTQRLNSLTEHSKAHSKDHHSRRGLMKLVGQRKRLLNYLQRKKESSYKSLISDLGIRK